MHPGHGTEQIRVRFCLVVGILLRVLAVFVGAAGLFLYENEEKRLDDWVNDWWIKLDDASKSADSRTGLFISRAAGITSSLSDQLLGPKLLSARTAVVGLGSSLCLTYASVIFFGRLAPHVPFIARGYTQPMPSDVSSLFRGVAWIVLSIYPAFLKNRYFVAAWFCYVSYNIVWPVLNVGIVVQHVWGGHFFERYLVTMVVCVALSAIPDFLFVAINRKILRGIRDGRRTFLNLLFLLAGNFILAVFIVAAPIKVGALLSEHFGTNFLMPIIGPLFFSSIFNLIDIVFASLFFIVAIFLLVYHYLFWPVVCRPFYGLARMGINTRRAQIWAFAIVLWNNHLILQLICK